MTAVHCHACDAPLAVDQRWCVACGARRAGADVRTLLFGPPSPAADETDPGVLAAASSQTGGPDRPAADAPSTDGSDRSTGAAAPAAAGAGSDPALLIARRRRAALPIALASLVGLVAATATSVPTSLAGSSQPPYTVVVPARDADASAQAAPAAEPVEPPAEEPLAPVAEAPVVPPPVTATPAAADGPATDGADDEDEQPARDPEAAPIRHVFLIALAGADLNALVRDEAAAPYLAGTLADEGTRLSGYRTIARGGFADRIALVSGQSPTAQTVDGCMTDGGTVPADGAASPAEPPADARRGVEDCVFDAKTKHVGDQLRAQKQTWKAYVEPAADAARTSTAERDSSATASGADVAGPGPSARAAAACDVGADTTRRNPFLWFRGTVERDDCDARNVPLTQLRKDLRAAKTTPALAWIASDAQQGSADADRFLERVVPLIQASPAYADGSGLIVIVGDQPPASPETPAPPADTTPAAPADATPSPPADASPTPPVDPAPSPDEGRDGVRVGALLVSPRTPSGKVDATRADAFTLLRTLQTIFELDPLGGDDATEARPLPKRLFSAAP